MILHNQPMIQYPGVRDDYEERVKQLLGYIYKYISNELPEIRVLGTFRDIGTGFDLLELQYFLQHQNGHHAGSRRPYTGRAF